MSSQDPDSKINGTGKNLSTNIKNNNNLNKKRSYNDMVVDDISTNMSEMKQSGAHRTN